MNAAVLRLWFATPRWVLRTVLFIGALLLLLVAASMPAHADISDQLCPDAPHECLPAWRWQSNSGQFFTDPGMNPIRALAQGASGSVTNLLFSLARFIWTLTLWFVRMATSIDWLGYDDESQRTAVGAAIDDGFLTVFDMVGGFVPLIFLAAVVTVVVSTVRTATGGRGKAEWKEMVRPAMCMGLLVAMVSAAGTPGSTWAPSWWIEKSAEITGQVWDATASPLADRVGEPPQWEARLAGGPVANDNSCDYFAKELHTQGQNAASGDSSAAAQYNVASLVSSMWHETHLYAWRVAQFDTTRSGARMYCYVLEHLNRHDPAQTLAVMNHDRQGNATSTVKPPLLAPTMGAELKRREFYMLAACERDGGSFRVADEWQVFRGGDSDVIESMVERCTEAQTGSDPNLIKRITGRVKEELAQGGRVVSAIGRGAQLAPGGGAAGELVENAGDALQDNAGDVFMAASSADIDRHTEPTDDGSSDDIVKAMELRDFMHGLTGDNISTATGVGFLALALAVVFGAALGGAAAGATIAQIGAIVMWVAFSAILMLGMWPTQAAGQRFYKALKLLAGLMIARFVMLGLLTVLVVLTSLFQTVVDVVNPLAMSSSTTPTWMLAANTPVVDLVAASGQRGWMRDSGNLMLQAFPPLAALFAMRYLFKQLGFVNPTSLGGAMKAVGALTTNFQDTSTHRSGQMGQLARRHLNPLSSYGALSLMRLPARARRMKRRHESGKNRDRRRPPEEASKVDGGPLGKGGPDAPRGAGTPGPKGPLPGPADGAVAAAGAAGVDEAAGGRGGDKSEDLGSRTLARRLVSRIDRIAQVSDAAGGDGDAAVAAGGRGALRQFMDEHPTVARLAEGSKKVARIAVPAAIAGGALGSLPLVGAAGLALQGGTGLLAYAGIRAATRPNTRQLGGAAAARLVTAAAPMMPDRYDGPVAQAVRAARARAGAGPLDQGVPLTPTVEPPQVTASGGSQALPKRVARVDLPANPVAAGLATEGGHTQHGEFALRDGSWFRNTQVESPTGGVWWEQIEYPHPAMYTPDGAEVASFEPAAAPALGAGPTLHVPGASALSVADLISQQPTPAAAGALQRPQPQPVRARHRPAPVAPQTPTTPPPAPADHQVRFDRGVDQLSDRIANQRRDLRGG